MLNNLASIHLVEQSHSMKVKQLHELGKLGSLTDIQEGVSAKFNNNINVVWHDHFTQVPKGIFSAIFLLL